MGLIDRFLVPAKVSEVRQVARRMKRVRFVGEGIARLRVAPGQQVRLVVGELLGMDLVRNDAVRTYSIWDHVPADGTLDLCILDHEGQGPGARFAQRVRVGDAVRFAGPEGKLVLAHGRAAHVFFGDETAQVAFGAILRAKETNASATGAIEVAHVEDALTLPGTHAVRVLERNGHAVGETLVAQARTLALPEDAVVYIAGEAKTCKAVRAVLLGERGLARKNVLLKPFWTPGAKGLE